MAVPLIGDARAAARRRFVEICAEETGPDVPLDLACALMTAEECPALDPDTVVTALDTLASGVRLGPVSTLYDAVARLNHRLYVEGGFHADQERAGEPRASFIDQVLEDGAGVPILMGVVYMEVARRAGVAIEGVGFPGHFLVAPREADPPFWIDPFNEGRVLRAEQLRDRLERMQAGRAVPTATFDRVTAPVTARYILVRIHNNLKGAYLRRKDVEGALRAVERLLILSSDLPSELRDRGLMRAHLGRAEEGLADLRAYLERWPDSPDRERVTEAITVLEGRQKS